MVTTSLVGAAAILLASLAWLRGARWGLRAAFTLISLFLSLRYNFGNDYEAYERTFQEISKCARASDFENPIALEMGWVYLNWLCRPIGFFGMTAVIAVGQCFVYYSLIARYVPRSLYGFAVFLYVFTPNLMLIQATAMRQAVAIMLFMVSLHFTQRREVWWFTLCIALASTFHFSAIVLWPVYLIGSPRARPGLAARIGIIFMFATLAFFGDAISPVVKQVVGSHFPRYDIYQEVGATRSGLGFVFAGAALTVLLLLEERLHAGRALLFRISALALMITPITLVLEMLSRFGMYLLPATIVAYPLVVKTLREPMAKGAFAGVVSAYTIVLFVQFVYSATYEPYFGQYQTILAAGPWR